MAAVEKTEIDGEVVAFVGIAEGEARRRLLLRRDEAIEEALSTQASFDGKQVANFSFSLENSRLAVWVLFSDGSTGIYSAWVGQGSSALDVPTLGIRGLGVAALLLAVAGFGALRRFPVTGIGKRSDT